MINKDMLIKDALAEGDPNVIASVLMGMGMHCIGCSLSSGETLAEAAMVHGLDVDEMVDALNLAIAEN